ALLYSGQVSEVARRVPRALAEAQDRGDLYTEATIGTYPEPWFLLAHDEPEAAVRALDHAVGRWTCHAFHLQHLGHMFATAETLPYRGEPAAAQAWLRGRWHDMTSSQLLRVRFLDVRAHEIAGRVAAVCARGPDDPAISECVRMARWLERQAQTWPRSL